MTRKAKPKTGERRQVRQPFAIDKLPSEWRDRIIALHAKWLTWEQLEEETKNFDWKKLEEKDAELVLSHFADRRIPHTTLHRWYDVQVEQKLEEAAQVRAASIAVANKFASGGYENLDASVKNALADAVFTLKNSDDPEKSAAALAQLNLALNRSRRTEIAEKRTEIAKQQIKVELQKLQLVREKVRGVKEDVAKKKMSSEELGKKLDEIYDLARPNA